MTVRILVMAASFLALLVAPAAAQQAETESARILAPGMIKGGAGVEYQTSSEGSETALPLIVEGGIAPRFELVVEQVAFVGLKPKIGSNESGAGDLEVTLVGLVASERERLPAIAFAAEVKAPTARNTAIGTGETDFAGYLILSKRFGALDISLNGSYTLVGPPPDGRCPEHLGIRGLRALHHRQARSIRRGARKHRRHIGGRRYGRCR